MNTRRSLARVVTVTLLAVTTLGVAGPVLAAQDGQMLYYDSTNLLTSPQQITVNGKKAVTATVTGMMADCPANGFNCKYQFRFAHKCTGFWCTWTEHGVQTFWQTGNRTLTHRCAGGDHYWKVSYRVSYETTVTQVNHHDSGLELGYKGNGTLETVYRHILKGIFSGGVSIAYWVASRKTVTSTSGQTNYTSWQDVDFSPGRVYTDSTC